MQILSWSELMVVLIIAGVIWYGYVLGKYYPELMKKKLKRNELTPIKWVREKQEVKENVLPHSSPSENQHAMVHELMEELKLIFAAAVRQELEKEQVKESISVRLRQFTSFTAAVKLSITQHIINEFSLQLKTEVTAEEINALWK